MGLWLLSLCGWTFDSRASDPAVFPDKVVAKGQGFEIRQSELDDAFIQLRATLRARNQPLSESQRLEAEALLLDRLIVIRVLAGRADADLNSKAREAAEKALADARLQAGSEENFQRQLKALGSDVEKFRSRLLEQALVEAYVEREVFRPIDVGADQARKFYDENQARFERPEMVRVAHILLATLDRRTGRELPDDARRAKRTVAEKALARAKQGDDFAALAKEYSDDFGSRDRGGEMAFGRAQDKAVPSVVPELESAAFALKANELSQIISTRYGYHIVKLLERMPAKKLSFVEAEAEIRKYLQAQQGRGQLGAYYERLKREAQAEILDERLRDVPRTGEAPGQPAAR